VEGGETASNENAENIISQIKEADGVKISQIKEADGVKILFLKCSEIKP
jgi:hypothetical protein